MDILSKTLDLIDNVINDIEIKDINFYDYLLNLMSSLYKNCSIALFFYENTNFILKSAVKDNKKTDITFPLSFENIERLFDSKDKFIKIKTQKTDFLKAEKIVEKIAIKELKSATNSFNSNVYIITSTDKKNMCLNFVIMKKR